MKFRRYIVPSYSWGIHDLRGPNGPSSAPTEKRCTRCERWKPLDAFRPNPRQRSGLASWCKECQLQRTREWRAANPDYEERYNAARRVKPYERTCVDCGTEFTAGRKDVVRCAECRRARRLDQRRERHRRAAA